MSKGKGKDKQKKPRVPSQNHLRMKENRRQKIEVGVPFIVIRRNGEEITVPKPVDRSRDIRGYRSRPRQKETNRIMIDYYDKRTKEKRSRPRDVVVGWVPPDWANFPRTPEQ